MKKKDTIEEKIGEILQKYDLYGYSTASVKKVKKDIKQDLLTYIIEMVKGERKDYVWQEFDNETGEETINFDPKIETFNGSTTQSTWNQALDTIKAKLEKL